MSLVQWFLTFWRNILSTQPADSLTYMQLWWLLFPGPLTVRRAPSMLHVITEVATLAAVLELVVDGAHHAAYQSFSLLLSCGITSPLWWFWTFYGWSLVSEQPFTSRWTVPLPRPWSYTLTPPTPSWLGDNLSFQLLSSNTASVCLLYSPCIWHFAGTCSPLEMNCFSSKFLEPPTQSCNMTSQKTWIRINSVRISDLAVNYL